MQSPRFRYLYPDRFELKSYNPSRNTFFRIDHQAVEFVTIIVQKTAGGMALHPEARTCERRSSKRKDLLANARCKVRHLWTKNCTTGEVWFSKAGFSKSCELINWFSECWIWCYHARNLRYPIAISSVVLVSKIWQNVSNSSHPHINLLELNYFEFEQFQLKKMLYFL